MANCEEGKEELKIFGPRPKAIDVFTSVLFYKLFREGKLVERISISGGYELDIKVSDKQNDPPISGILQNYIGKTRTYGGILDTQWSTSILGGPVINLTFVETLKFFLGYIIAGWFLNQMGLPAANNTTNSVKRYFREKMFDANQVGYCYRILIRRSDYHKLGRFPKFREVIEVIKESGFVLGTEDIKIDNRSHILHCSYDGIKGLSLSRHIAIMDENVLNRRIGFRNPFLMNTGKSLILLHMIFRYFDVNMFNDSNIIDNLKRYLTLHIDYFTFNCIRYSLIFIIGLYCYLVHTSGKLIIESFKPGHGYKRLFKNRIDLGYFPSKRLLISKLLEVGKQNWTDNRIFATPLFPLVLNNYLGMSISEYVQGYEHNPSDYIDVLTLIFWVLSLIALFIQLDDPGFSMIGIGFMMIFTYNSRAVKNTSRTQVGLMLNFISLSIAKHHGTNQLLFWILFWFSCLWYMIAAGLDYGLCYTRITRTGSELGYMPYAITVADWIDGDDKFDMTLDGSVYHITKGTQLTTLEVKAILESEPDKQVGSLSLKFRPASFILCLLCCLIILCQTGFEKIYIFCVVIFFMYSCVKDGNNGKPKFKIFTFGSYGDTIPMEYYKKYLISLGLDCIQHNILNREEGKEALDLVEKGNFLCLTNTLTKLPAMIEEWLKDGDSYALSPQHGLGIKSRVITYEVAPPPYVLKSWDMLPNNSPLSWLVNKAFRLSHQVMHPDVRIGSFIGCAPRSCDGLNLLKQKENLNTGKILIALGSSSIDEPDIEGDVWSCRSGTKYKFEKRTNHADIMVEYSKVYTHGGAGTMATAAACGCEVISLSKLIDRNYIENPPFLFKQDAYTFLRAILLKLSFEHQLWCIYSIFKNDKKTGLKAILTVLVCHLSNVFFLGYCVLFMVIPRFVFSLDFDLNTFIERFFFGSERLIIVSILLVPTLSWIRWGRAPIDKAILIVEIIKYSFFGINESLSSGRFYLTKGIFGTPLAIVVDLILGEYFDVNIPALVRAQLDMIYALFCANDSRTGTIKINIIKIEDVPNMLPLYHVEFVNLKLMETVGITAENCDVLRCKYYEGTFDKTKEGSLWNTRITTDNWSDLKEKYKKHDNKMYSPLNNCQTTLLDVKSAYGRGYEDPLMGLLIVLTGLVTITLGVGGTLIIIGFGWMIPKQLVLTALSPTLLGAGNGRGLITNMYEMMVYLFSPSVSNGIVDTSKKDNYPIVEASTEKHQHNGYMNVKFKGHNRLMKKPLKGIHRPNYQNGRDGNRSMPHGCCEWVIKRHDEKTWGYVEILHEKMKSVMLNWDDGKPQNIAVVATTSERPLDKKWINRLINRHHKVIILSDSKIDDENFDIINVIIPVSGRHLAFLRCCFPPINGTSWFVYNSTSNDKHTPDILIAKSHHLKDYDFVSQMWYGLHQASCSGLIYKKSPMNELLCLNGLIYGSDELMWKESKGLLIVRYSEDLMSQVYKECESFNCKRTIEIYDEDEIYIPLLRYNVENWGPENHLLGFKNIETGERVDYYDFNDDGIVINGFTINIGPLATTMYDGNNCYDVFMKDIQHNLRSTLDRIQIISDITTNKIKKGMVNNEYEQTLICCEKILSAFNYGSSTINKTKGYKLDNMKNSRIAELGIVLHENPKFIDATYDETLSYVLGHLNAYGKYTLSPHEFVRNTNRNVNVDLLLKKRAHDFGIPDGVDGQVIACKEIVINSLARYIGSSNLNALLDDDIRDVVGAIVEVNPELYCNARLANPGKLIKHFYKNKKYSAGLPFIGKGESNEPKIKTRSDLRKFKWFQGIHNIALEPFITGRWYPGLSHAFAKSQVVNIEKLVNNPAKLRTVVATSVVNNVQQGVLHFDINNRHAPHNGPSKVGITMNGRVMGSVFSELARFKKYTSLDATAFDSTLSNTVFQMEAEVRKYGYKDTPYAEIINRHIDCAMEQTQKAYVVNLIAETWEEVVSQSTGECKRVFDMINPQIKNEYTKKMNEISFEHVTAPGRVLYKEHGGSTGDSNTTFTNTIGLEVVLVYSLCKSLDMKPSDFFKNFYLANVGDDNVLGHDINIDFEKAFKISLDTFGVTFRVESSGDGILNQTFLGKIPKYGLNYKDDFDIIGIEVPEFAILHEREKLLMRYSNYKTDAQRYFKNNREHEYIIQKGIGYLNLTAHQPDLYDLIRQDLEIVLSKMDPKRRKALKPRLKLPSYKKVLEDWYKPGSLNDLGKVNMLQFTNSKFARTEIAVQRFCRMAKYLTNCFPSHLTNMGYEGKDTMEIVYSDGTFECHAWHIFTKEHKRSPTEDELIYMLNKSPYRNFVDASTWLRTTGNGLPTSGVIFERNLNYSVAKFWHYTSVYFYLHKSLCLVNKLPFGGVVTDLMNLTLFSSRNMFGSLDYIYYGGKANNSASISALNPRDPYRYHKRAAMTLAPKIPLPRLVSILPIYKLNNIISNGIDKITTWHNISLFNNRVNAISDKINVTPWSVAARSCYLSLTEGKTITVSAPTGSGKTRFLPTEIFKLLDHKKLCVVMPRRLLCEEFARRNNVTFVKKSNPAITPMFTCTYGYLSALESNGKLNEFALDTEFIFDEAHETSIEWTYLKETFINRKPSILLTATPTRDMVRYKHIEVPVLQKFKVECKIGEEFIDTIKLAHLMGFKRILAIHPIKHMVEEICKDLKPLGFSVMSSSKREVPLKGHIIATSIVDAGITIPDCDCVVDSGLRVVNHQGQLLTVAIDNATSIQRRGRTGRTCDGTYFLCKKPIDKIYEPSPDIISILSSSKLAKHFKVDIKFDKPPYKYIYGDDYAFQNKFITDDTLKSNISLYHKLRLKLKDVDATSAYKRIWEGRPTEEENFLLELSNCGLGNLLPIQTILENYEDNQPYYKIGDQVILGKLAVEHNTVICKSLPFPTGFCNDEEGCVKSTKLNTK